jgi:hypothetical protein
METRQSQTPQVKKVLHATLYPRTAYLVNGKFALSLSLFGIILGIGIIIGWRCIRPVSP